MRQYFELDRKEKQQEYLLLTFAILSFLIIAKGVYNQYHNIDQDYILIPLITAIYGSYFLIYGINGFTKGNLIRKWTPFFVFNIVNFIIERTGFKRKDRSKIFTTKLLAILGLMISVGFFAATIAILIKG